MRTYLKQRQHSFTFLLWLFTLVVIVWGAWVRISKSGDGCGDHWPLCEGALIPNLDQSKTWIEFVHRLMSGIYGIIIIGVFLYFRKTENRITKLLNSALLVLMISEALLGAVLVKGQLVSENDSLLRLLVMSFHQINSFLLTGVTSLFYFHLKAPGLRLHFISTKTLIIFLALPMTGAIAALSTTLFPAQSLFQGILEDFSSNQHLFVNLRVLHPIIAILFCCFFISWSIMNNHYRFGFELAIVFSVGIVTLLLLSPLYLKLLHLLLAHIIWNRFLYRFVSFPDSNSR